jgi:DNA-binding NtrC family response regulator
MGDYMTYKELKKYYWLNQKIKDLEKEIAHLETLSAVVMNDMPKSKNSSSPTEQFAIKKEKMVERLNKLKLSALVKLEEVESFINEIPDEELECIFRETFILGYKQKQVAKEHHMDRTTIYYKIKNYLDGISGE